MERGFIFFSILLALIHSVLSAPLADEIKSIPGWDGNLPSKQYSGYLNITESKHYHYWFVECETDPENAPILLWLNGGPGCSSLTGLFLEHGPFRLDTSDKVPTLKYFDYTWTKKASMIYLESPLGVGFSYSDNEDEYHWDDDTTVSDNIKCVEEFFELFPEYINNSLYIAGESYGGIYVPTLAEAILHATINGSYNGPSLNGIAVGNGCTGTEIGVCSTVSTSFLAQFFVQNTAFISQSSKKELNENCDWDDPNNASNACSTIFGQIRKKSELDKISHYDIYHDTGVFSNELNTYIGQETLMKEIHVSNSSSMGHWKECNMHINYNYRQTRPNLPRDTYPFLNNKIRVLIYNGDWDAVVPYTDNEWWTRNMRYPIAHDWHPWIYNGTELGGYATTYDTKYNFTFITVRGGAHMVPVTAPVKAFEMFKMFIDGKQF